MNYKAAYEKAMAECTRLEKEIEEKDKTIEEKDRTIEEKDRTIEKQNKIKSSLNPSVSLTAATSLKREAFMVFDLPKPPLSGEVPEWRKGL